ncbi:hypothetical protein JCM11641_002275 [Rhodosporidiobolus odoratus]
MESANRFTKLAGSKSVPALFGNDQATASALLDLGAQADVLSPALAHRLGVEISPQDSILLHLSTTAGSFSPSSMPLLAHLGYTNRQMTWAEVGPFVICALRAGVPPPLVNEFVEIIEFEQHNPLLDVDDDVLDDPNDLSESEARQALDKLLGEFADDFVDELPGPPPFRPVNHSIPLLDTEKKIRPHAICIPDRFAAQWSVHLRTSVETGFWSPAALDLACAMLAVPKHDKSQAWFVINLKPRDNNTAKLASPIPNMKQTRLDPESVLLSGFVTPNGMFVSHVMQQGDTNAPETMHQVCYMMFGKAAGRFLDLFYDDVLVCSNTFRVRLCYLCIIFTTLHHFKFYPSRSKVEFMTDSMEVLGAVVDSEGVHVLKVKWEAVQGWPEPKNAKDVLWFMGTLQWMSDHLPVMFPMESGQERLFLFTDALVFGCGGWIGQAQRNYTTTDQELLAVFVGAKKMHDHLIGWRFTVVCDHEPLKTWLRQPPKQQWQHGRLWESLAEYDMDWE